MPMVFGTEVDELVLRGFLEPCRKRSRVHIGHAVARMVERVLR